MSKIPKPRRTEQRVSRNYESGVGGAEQTDKDQPSASRLASTSTRSHKRDFDEQNRQDANLNLLPQMQFAVLEFVERGDGELTEREVVALHALEIGTASSGHLPKGDAVKMIIRSLQDRGLLSPTDSSKGKISLTAAGSRFLHNARNAADRAEQVLLATLSKASELHSDIHRAKGLSDQYKDGSKSRKSRDYEGKIKTVDLSIGGTRPIDVGIWSKIDSLAHELGVPSKAIKSALEDANLLPGAKIDARTSNASHKLRPLKGRAQWMKRDKSKNETPVDFVQRVYADRLPQLTRADIFNADKSLYRAIRFFEQEHGLPSGFLPTLREQSEKRIHEFRDAGRLDDAQKVIATLRKRRERRAEPK